MYSTWGGGGTHRRRAWIGENLPRNAIAQGLADAAPDDEIMISDIDEIPDPEKVRKWAFTPGLKNFDQKYCSFYLNFRNVRQRHWFGTVMLQKRLFDSVFDDVDVIYNEFLAREVNEGTTATKIRCARRLLPASRARNVWISDGGWHFTCLGGVQAVIDKLTNAAPHHGDSADIDTVDHAAIPAMIAKGLSPGLKMNCFAERLDASYPAYLRANAQRYEHLLYPVTDEYLRSVRLARALRTAQGIAIHFAERAIPPRLHNLLHRIRLAMRGVRND